MELTEAMREELRKKPWRDRVHLTTGTTKIADPILKADVIVFERGARLELGVPDAPYVAIVAREVFFHDGASPCTLVIARRNGRHGADGADGADATRLGAHGVDGQSGQNASDPTMPPPFVFYCEDIAFGQNPDASAPPLLIDAAGGNGANGGAGGDGGDGMKGAKGWPGLATDGDFHP